MTIDEKIQILWDYALAHPDGFTRYDIADDLGWTNTDLSHIARHLRMFFADDEITLTATPQGKGAAWLYQLVGNVEDAAPWSRNRLMDAETRLQTMHAVAQSLVNATDGRTMEGRRARIMEKALRRLNEDLIDLHASE